jgi:hypothetical protein
MRLTTKQILEIRNKRPLTHELGGLFLVDDAGVVRDMEYTEGDPCRDAHGNLLHTVAHCSVTHTTGHYVFHTHPRANRPSSGDLYNAVVGRARQHFIFTPTGVWSYRATDRLKQLLTTLDRTQQRRLRKHWRFLGHMFQEQTQQDDCNAFIRLMELEGFEVGFLPYTALHRASTFDF